MTPNAGNHATNGGNGGGGANGGSGRRKNARRRHANKRKPVELWRPVPQLPDPAPIHLAADPGMLMRSLGSPPLHGQGAQAEHTFELVVRRSAQMAAALAATAGLLADDRSEAESS
jgi:hypothetical protein